MDRNCPLNAQLPNRPAPGGQAFHPGYAAIYRVCDRGFITELTHGLHVFARTRRRIPCPRSSSPVRTGSLAVLSGLARCLLAPHGALAVAPPSVPRRPPRLPYKSRNHRDRDPPGRAIGPPGDHRPRHGRRHRRDGRGGGRRLSLPPGDLGRHQHPTRQAAPNARPQRHRRRRGEDPGRYPGRRRCAGRGQRRRRAGCAGRDDRGRYSGSAARTQPAQAIRQAGVRRLWHPLRRRPRPANVPDRGAAGGIAGAGGAGHGAHAADRARPRAAE